MKASSSAVGAGITFSAFHRLAINASIFAARDTTSSEPGAIAAGAADGRELSSASARPHTDDPVTTSAIVRTTLGSGFMPGPMAAKCQHPIDKSPAGFNLSDNLSVLSSGIL